MDSEDSMNEANRVIAMNPSGVIETYDNETKDVESGNRLQCTGDVCYVNDDVTESKTNYMNYIYIILSIIILLGLGYLAYKKFVCKE